MDNQGFPIKNISNKIRCDLMENSDYKKFVEDLNNEHNNKKKAAAENVNSKKKENENKLKQGEMIEWSKEEMRALKIPYNLLMDPILEEYFSFVMLQ